MNAMRTAFGSLVASRFAIGCVALAVLLVLLVSAFTGNLKGWLSGGDGYERAVSAVFADTQQLRVGDTVRMRGVDVGKVDAIKLQPGARTSEVRMLVNDDAGELHRDARAEVRWKLVLGGQFYVGIDPGTPSSGQLADATIPASRTSGQIELDDVLNIAKGGAARGLQTMPGELARGLERSRDPARALRSLDEAAPDLAVGVGALRGEIKDTDLRNLVTATAKTVAGLDTPTDRLRGAVSGASSLLTTTGRRDAELAATIDMAPDVLRDTRVTTARLDRTLGQADPLLAALREPASDLGPTVSRLRPTVVRADRLLRDARPLFASLRPAVKSLARTAAVGGPLLDALAPSIGRLDKTVLPYFNELDPLTGLTAAQAIGPNLGGFGGAAGQEDGKSHLIRFPATGGSSSVYLPCQTYVNNPDKDQLAECKSFQELFDTYTEYAPLSPAPGTSGGPERSAP